MIDTLVKSCSWRPKTKITYG